MSSDWRDFEIIGERVPCEDEWVYAAGVFVRVRSRWSDKALVLRKRDPDAPRMVSVYENDLREGVHWLRGVVGESIDRLRAALPPKDPLESEEFYRLVRDIEFHNAGSREALRDFLRANAAEIARQQGGGS